MNRKTLFTLTVSSFVLFFGFQNTSMAQTHTMDAHSNSEHQSPAAVTSASNPFYVSRDYFDHHRGMVLGGSMGVGFTMVDQCKTCRGTGGNLGMDFQVGGFIHPRIAILLDLSGFSKTESETFIDEYGYPYTAEYRASSFMAAVAAQVWVMPRLWVRAGLGPANFKLNIDDGIYSSESTAEAIGGTAALGYEMVSFHNVALELSGRVNMSKSDAEVDVTNIGFFIGARWK